MVMNEFVFLTKILNNLIKKGKKNHALKTLLKVILNLKSFKIENFNAFQIIQQGLINTRPLLHVKKVRKSSKIFYLPKIITVEKKNKIALHWIIKSINARKERKLESRLSNEFLDCFNNKGLSISKKQNLYDTISANRPFLHLLIYK